MRMMTCFSEICIPYKMHKRNVFDPPPMLPVPKGPLPNGVELEEANPYLDTMHEPVDLKYGIAVHSSPGNSPQLGGRVYFPTGHLMRPKESFEGSYAQSRSIQARVGMQGGPFLPWQNPQYAQNVREIQEAAAINSDSFRRYDTTNGVRRDSVSSSAIHPQRQQQFIAPPLLLNKPQGLSNQPITPLIPPPAMPVNNGRFYYHRQ